MELRLKKAERQKANSTQPSNQMKTRRKPVLQQTE